MALMTQQEIDQIIATGGGAQMAHGVVGKRTVKNPKYDKIAVASGRSNEPETIEVDVQQWVGPNGYTIQAVQMPDGSGWDVIRNEPPPPKPAAGTTPASARTAREEAEIAANAALPPDQDPRPETNAERAARADATRKAQDTTVASVTYQGTGKNRKKVTEYQSGRKVTEDAATNATATGVTYDTDGTKVTKYDDGTETREQLSPQQRRAEEEARRSTRTEKPYVHKDGKTYTEVTEKDPTTGRTRTFYTDTTGKEVVLPGGGAKMPASVKPPTEFRYGTAAQTLAEFWKQLNDAVTRGEITGTEAAELFAPYHQQAQTAVTEQTNIINTQRGIMSDETSQRGQDLQASTARGSQAAGIFNNSMNQMTELNKTVNVGSDAAGKAFLASLKLGKNYVDEFGGLREVPRTTMLPAVQQAAQATLNQSSVVPGSGTPSPQSVAAPPVAAAAPAAVAPIFRPQPVAPAPRTSTTAPAAPAGAPPVSAPAPSAPVTAPAPVQAKVRFRNTRTGEVREMTPMELDAMPDLADWYALDPNAAGSTFSPQQGNPQPAPPTSGIPGNPDYQPGLPPGTSIVPQPAPEVAAPPPLAAPFQDEQRHPGYGSTMTLYPSVSTGTDAPPSGATELPLPPTNTLPVAPQGQMAPSGLLPGVQAAMQPPQYDPEGTAGMLLSMGFDQDVVDGAYQQRYGKSLFSRGAA